MDLLRTKNVFNMNSNWDKLSTISTFDSGPPEEPQETELLFNKQIMKHNTPVTTPVSLLIQSLVHQLCLMIEKDQTRATNLYKNICDKLYQMKLLDETYGKGEFEIMRTQYQRALCQLIEITNNPDLLINMHTPLSISSKSVFSWSRYFSDFREISFIAKGGFGSVFKAKNNVDGIDYAVKKIDIHFKDINSISSHLSEVQTLASLNHPNIVPYKSAWLEPLIEYQTKNIKFAKGSSTQNSDESDSYLENKSESTDFEISFKNSMDGNANVLQKTFTQVTESVEDCKVICKLSSAGSKNLVESAHLNLDWATLYIQMSLCDSTLKAWLEKRNNFVKNGQIQDFYPCHVQKAMDIFQQLTNGLNYIHTRNVIHHDVKPSNIFIAEDCGSVEVKLGDFGLACPQQRVQHTGAFGTCLYAAPEQLNGICNVKNDVYSIGLIMSELIQAFSTDMEKVEVFKNLREGKISDVIVRNCPKLALIIEKLLKKDMDERIDTAELLQMLKALNGSQDEKIRALERELLEHKEEIAKLKQLLLKQ